MGTLLSLLSLTYIYHRFTFKNFHMSCWRTGTLRSSSNVSTPNVWGFIKTYIVLYICNPFEDQSKHPVSNLTPENQEKFFWKVKTSGMGSDVLFDENG